MLLNLTSLIAQSNTESKVVMAIILNSACVIVNLSIFVLIYAQYKADIINLVLQL